MSFASTEWVKDLLRKVLKKNNKYSTEETVVGEWIDGKPIYRKVVTIPADTSQTTTQHIQEVTIPIPNIDIAWVNYDKSYILYEFNGGKQIIPVVNNWNSVTNGNGLLLQTSKSNILLIWSRYIWWELPATMVIEYTKTTD